MPLDINMYESNATYRSWVDNTFKFIEPNQNNGNLGLRKPQLAALYITLGHLISAPDTPATIVIFTDLSRQIPKNINHSSF